MKRVITAVFALASFAGSSAGAAQAMSPSNDDAQVVYAARLDPHVCLVCVKFISNNEVWCYEEPCP